MRSVRAEIHCWVYFLTCSLAFIESYGIPLYKRGQLHLDTRVNEHKHLKGDTWYFPTRDYGKEGISTDLVSQAKADVWGNCELGCRSESCPGALTGPFPVSISIQKTSFILFCGLNPGIYLFNFTKKVQSYCHPESRAVVCASVEPKDAGDFARQHCSQSGFLDGESSL